MNTNITSQKTLSRFHYGYVIVGCCFLIMLVIVGLVMSCAGIFYKPVSEDLGVDVGQLGIYMSFNFLFSTLTLSFAGKVMERFSARVVLTVSSAVTGLCFAVMSAFTSLWQFYVVGAVFGIALAFLLYLGFATMVNRWFKSKVGLFIGICSAGSGIGGVLFNPLAGYLITHYGWRTTYLLFGVTILLLVTPILGVLLRSHPEDKGLKPYEKKASNNAALKQAIKVSQRDVDYKRALRMPLFYGMIAFAFLMNAAATLNVFIPAFMQDSLYSIEEASFVASATMVGVTVGKVILGMINDKSAVIGVLTTTGLGIIGLLLMLAGHVGIVCSIAGGFFFGWAYAGVSVQTPLLVRKVFGQTHYAEIYSNVAMSLTIGGAISASVWGIAADVWSYPLIFAVGITFLLISGGIGWYALKSEVDNKPNKYKK